MKMTIVLAASLLLAVCLSSQMTASVSGDSAPRLSLSMTPTPTPGPVRGVTVTVKNPTSVTGKGISDQETPNRDVKLLMGVAKIDCSKGGCPGHLTGTITLENKLTPEIATFTCREITISLYKTLPNKIDSVVVVSGRAKGDISTGKCQYDLNVPAMQTFSVNMFTSLRNYPGCAHSVLLSNHTPDAEISPIASGKKLIHDFKIALTCNNEPG